ncbi:MAG: TatD family hydrolase [Syntrophomonadaceae bacterium]|jgi:TatD DNase family protein|nr:TatD family hydrolase [Syntrophomonadaceae bacterium]
MLIDSHVHLQDKKLISDLPVILANAKAAEIDYMICVGYDYASSCKAVDLAHKYSQIYAVVGVHPHDADTLDEKTLSELYALAKKPKVVAIGEMGLDYYRNLSPQDQQKKAFISQIHLAKELYKPIVIHDRDAHQDVLDIIKKEKAGVNQGIMHCFSGHLPFAIEIMQQNFYISFAGPITYKNAKKTHEVAAKITMDRILVETDCPYLSPEPLRGKRNEPANVTYVAAKLAELRRKSLPEVEYLTSRNSKQVFRITG